MPWKEASVMSLRMEFVSLASAGGVSFRELCKRYAISPKTGYKWLRRYTERGKDGLLDLSRRPHYSPNRIPVEMEEMILALRDEHPVWGPRKLHARLGEQEVTRPSISTIAAVLKRNERIKAEETSKHQAFTRFEAEHPNQLWQMDFKGHFPLAEGSRCHPLTVLDDHSRFLLCLKACGDETWQTVQSHLRDSFRLYGLPNCMIFDNGSPWGSDLEHPYTPLGAWLIRLGIRVSHSRPRHPQTLGKDERLHRTLKAELLSRVGLRDMEDGQAHFDQWRRMYNHERPHEALGMEAPARRYHPSDREFPEVLPPIEYGSGYIVRKVGDQGRISIKGREVKVGRAFEGYPVGLLPTKTDGHFDVYFCHQRIGQIDITYRGT